MKTKTKVTNSSYIHPQKNSKINIEEYREYCLFKKGVTESIPFSKLPDLLVEQAPIDDFSLSSHPK